MNILYIAPSGKPPVAGTDGLCTEIGYFRKSFGGDYLSMSASRSVSPHIPLKYLGLRHWLTLKQFSRNTELIHVFFPQLVDFFVLKNLPVPVVYTIISGVEAENLPKSAPLYTLVVSSEQEADILSKEGFRDVYVIRPGIDLTRITPSSPPDTDSEFVILAGSAPWNEAQFGTKGFDLLLELLHRVPEARLVCLWRGALRTEWDERVRRSGLSDRVEVIGEKTDVSRVLSRCHCAVVLASQAGLVKSWPNSLMEALAAGRPVITSRAIPMASYVEETGCGRVVDAHTIDDLADALKGIMNHYETYQAAAGAAGGSNISRARMIEEYRELYRELIKPVD